MGNDPGRGRSADWGLLALRLAVGVVFLVHGTGKWGVWSAPPSEQAPGGMATAMKILSIAEPLGGAALILGLLTPVAALGLGVVMVGAIHMKMNVWKVPFQGQQGTGWEFDFVLLAGLVCLLLAGAGRLSVDGALTRR